MMEYRIFVGQAGYPKWCNILFGYGEKASKASVAFGKDL